MNGSFCVQVHWAGRNGDGVRIQFPGAIMGLQQRPQTSFLDASLRLCQARIAFFCVFLFREHFRAGERMSDIWDMRFFHESTLSSGNQNIWCPPWIIWRWNCDFKHKKLSRSFTMWTSMTGPDVKPSPRVCLFLVDTVWTVPVLSEPTGDEQLMLLSGVCFVQVAIGTSGACCRCSFPCYQLILCTRLCVHDSRHAAHNGSRNFKCPSRPTLIQFLPFPTFCGFLFYLFFILWDTPSTRRSISNCGFFSTASSRSRTSLLVPHSLSLSVGVVGEGRARRWRANRSQSF